MNNDQLRKKIYSGELVLNKAIDCSAALVETVLTFVRKELGNEYRSAQFTMTDAEYLSAVKSLKQAVFEDRRIRELTSALVLSYGFEIDSNVIEPARLRLIKHNGHLDPRALAAYHAHRDTWFANPQAQINWWLPLHDVSEQETMRFYIDRFDKPVANSSSDFSFDRFITEGGFGRSHNNSNQDAYPMPKQALTEFPTRNYSAGKGDTLLFSGSHLHQTMPNDTGLTRLSIDFRTVNIQDFELGLGAPNVDNASSGCAFKTYVPLAELTVEQTAEINAH